RTTQTENYNLTLHDALPILGNIKLDKTKKISEVIDGYTLFEENDIVMAKVTPCFENRNIAICKGLKNKIGFGSSELNTIRVYDKDRKSTRLNSSHVSISYAV